MPSEIIPCVDCKEEFEHDEREQEFFQQQGFQKPKRCKDCRRKKKERFGDK